MARAMRDNPDDDDDPVIAEYDVFITPGIQERMFLLQYPNRGADQTFSRQTSSQPSQLRIKESSGFIEVDVPLDLRSNINKGTAVRWGEALRKTQGQGQRAFGLAAGFERVNIPRVPTGRPGAQPGTTAPAHEEEENIVDYIQNFQDANDKGHVLNTQTFGGQVLKEEPGNARYMVGTFKGDKLHLTQLDGVVQMRTQFSHLDAMSQLEAQARKREKEAAEGAKPSEPRAITMQHKRGGTAGDPNTATTKAFLRTAFEEKWTKLRYVDEEDDEAYAAYGENLFVKDTAAVPKLVSTMNNDQYLDAISAPSGGKKRPPPRKRKPGEPASDESDESEAEAPAKQPDAEKMDVDEN